MQTKALTPHHTVAFVTSSETPAITPDDQLVANKLAEHHVNVHGVAWDHPNVDWSSFDLIVIRSAWNYQQKPIQYQQWLATLPANTVANNLQATQNTIDKRYLSTLAQKGINIIPIDYVEQCSGRELSDIMRDNNWDQVVIKPAIGASGTNVWKSSRNTAQNDHQRFKTALKDSALLVQPFIPTITTKGEWSFIFFDRTFSHAVIKKPAENDFRVQKKFGGTSIIAPPPNHLLMQATKMIENIPDPLLYARIDAIQQAEQLLLMEVEINEPHLYLSSCNHAAESFSKAILKFLQASQFSDTPCPPPMERLTC